MTAEDIRSSWPKSRRRSPPCPLRSDDSPEFVAQVVRSWLEGRAPVRCTWHRSPGRTLRESFHSKVRDEFLDREEFESEPQAERWCFGGESIIRTPAQFLGYRTPAEFSATCERYVPIEEDPPDASFTESTNR